MSDNGTPGSQRLELADLVCLTGGRTRRYATRPIPDERDIAIVALLRKAGRTGGLGQLLELIRPDVEAETLRTFAVRMASCALRRTDPELLRLGVCAMALAALRGTARRDDAAAFAPLWHAAGQVGLDPAAEFATTASAVPAAAPLLAGWSARPASQRELRMMGFHLSTDVDGPRYTEDWTLLAADFDREFTGPSLLDQLHLPRRWRNARAAGRAARCLGHPPRNGLDVRPPNTDPTGTDSTSTDSTSTERAGTDHTDGATDGDGPT
ncbi:hypothetical protein MXD59_11180 [Frankia sp. Ag45/Mut15]|uniref:Uncharacterized protein n=1 Tax=Frankia umida TaxID=573489 RepID=A0ABT0JXR5_9ACTN|nr:hypothetical protein [Frankia umida]MCK9876331.1 hypothetical protein [Frankia umida]